MSVENQLLVHQTSYFFFLYSTRISCLLELEESKFSLDTPAISAKTTVFANHSMTRNHECSRVGCASSCHSSRRFGLPQLLCDLTIGGCLAEWNGLDDLPDPRLKHGCLYVE